MNKIIQISTSITIEDGGQPISKTLALDDLGNIYELKGKRLEFVSSLSGKEEK